MSRKLGRREVVVKSAAAVAGGMLLMGGSAEAQLRPPQAGDTLAGEWFNGGKLGEPCAIFQQGRVLLLINEKGDLATGQFIDPNTFTVLKGWEGELLGRVGDRGKTILWKGGGNWKRR